MGTPWLDLTIRPATDCEVDVQPDGNNTFELSWALPGSSRITVLIGPDDAKGLSARLAELVVLVPGGTL